VGRISSHHFLRSVHNPRQPDCEGRTAAGLALDRDVAAHHLTKATADGETEARAAVFVRRGRGSLGELLEQLAYLLRRHADAGVSDRNGGPIVAIRASEVHLYCIAKHHCALQHGKMRDTGKRRATRKPVATKAKIHPSREIARWAVAHNAKVEFA